MKRLLATAAFAMAATGCEAVAQVDLHYKDNADASHPSGDDAAPPDAGAISVTDGAAVGAGGFCGCNLRQGEGCCVPPDGGTSFCTLASEGCVGSGGLYVGCIASSPDDDSQCCWSNGLGAGSQLAYAANGRITCGTRPVSCMTSSDCNGGECKVALCGGVRVGACGVTPVCP